jgi:hypothetical protein
MLPVERMPSTFQSSTIWYCDALALLHRHREHVPVGDVGAAGEIPPAADQEPALGPAARALRKRDAGGDQRVGIGAPDFLLRAFVVEREHPVVDLQVGEVPAHRGVAA